jgi:hypothetical protein
LFTLLNKFQKDIEMLSALIHSLEPGRICDIVQPGQEFEVHSNFSWVNVPDGTTTSDSYDPTTNTVTTFDPLSDPAYASQAYKVARQIAYGSIGDQLDMLHKELTSTGSISPTGQWATQISNAKSNIPKDDPSAVHAWNISQAQQNAVNANVITINGVVSNT